MAQQFGQDTHEVKYRHSVDGELYKHEFRDGVEIDALDDGTLLLSHKDGKPLWEEFEEMPIYMVNPRKKKTRRGSPRKKRRTAAQQAATKKMIAANKRKRAGKPKRRWAKAVKRTATKRRRSTVRSNPRRASTMPARKRKRAAPKRRRAAPRKRTTKRRRTTAKRAASAGRALSYRRNQPRQVQRLLKPLIQGLQDGATVTIGKAASNIIASFIPFGNGGMAMEVAKQAGSALVVSMVANQFMGREFARFATAGALAAPMEAFIKQANIPFVSQALGDGVYALSSGYGPYAVGAYPMAPEVTEGVGAYPQLSSYPQSLGEYPAEDVVDFMQV